MVIIQQKITEYLINPLSSNPTKMVKHTQTIRHCHVDKQLLTGCPIQFLQELRYGTNFVNL